MCDAGCVNGWGLERVGGRWAVGRVTACCAELCSEEGLGSKVWLRENCGWCGLSKRLWRGYDVQLR
jgi:hypothetical protein